MLSRKMAKQKTVDLLAKNSNENYCSVVEFLKHAGKPANYKTCRGCSGDRACDYKAQIVRYGDRLLVQFKEIEIFAWLLGERLNRKIPLGYAAEVWTKSPLADKFHEYYDTLEIDDDLDLVFGPKKRAEEAARMSTSELLKLIEDYETRESEEKARHSAKESERVLEAAVA